MKKNPFKCKLEHKFKSNTLCNYYSPPSKYNNKEKPEKFKDAMTLSALCCRLLQMRLRAKNLDISCRRRVNMFEQLSPYHHYRCH